MRISAVGRVGIAMMLGGIILYVGMKLWFDSRSFNPVDVPISLHKGTTLKKEFSVNIGGWYRADISTAPHRWSMEDYEEECQQWFSLEIRDAGGNAIKTYSTYSGSADLKPGSYSIVVVILRDAPLHSRYNPHFQIYTDSERPEFLFLLARWVAVILIGTGVLLIVRQVSVGERDRLAEERAFATPPSGSFQSGVIRSRVRSERGIKALPSFGLYGVTVVLVALIPIWILTIPSTPHGIWVNILRDPPPTLLVKQLQARIVLRVNCLGKTPVYQVNERIVELTALREALKQELARQPGWIVFLDGDTQCRNEDVVNAIDAVRGVHARVVLVTPATRHLVENAPANTASRK